MLAVLVGATGLLGWATGVDVLTRGPADLEPLWPVTAVCLVLLGTSLWLLTSPRGAGRTLGAGLAAIAGLAGVAALLAYGLGVHSILDTLLWPDAVLVAGGLNPGRPTVSSAIGVTLMSVGLLARRGSSDRALALSDTCGAAVLAVTLPALLGYLYSAALATFYAGPHLAVAAALGLTVLGAGLLMAPPRGPVMRLAVSTGPGGRLVRRLVPAIGAALVALGWVRLIAEDSGLIGLPFAVAAMASTTSILATLAIGRTAQLLERTAERERAALARLNESELRYRSLVNVSFDGVAVYEHGIIREANTGLAEMFGYRVNELIGRPVLDLVSADYREQVSQDLLAGREGTYRLSGLRKDGRPFEMESVAKRLGAGHEGSCVTAARDVTSQRQFEQRLAEAERLEAVEQVAGGLAHDFSNLLTVIIGSADLLLHRAPTAQEREDLESIRAAAASAADLTRQLLAFSRRQVLEPQVLSLNEAVKTALPLLGRLVRERVTIRTVLADDLRPIAIDPGQLQQILLNLAVNARDAMPSGGSITIETANITFDDSYARTHPEVVPGEYAQLVFSDTGVGMEEQTRLRVFEPFFTTKERGRGTGLGLATVYGIVKQSGGYTWVLSEPGLGSRFELIFPVSVGVAGPRRERPATPALAAGRETVLLVEDDRSLSDLVRRVLLQQGYSVIEAADGGAALEAAAGHEGPIHLLLANVILPDMNGSELAEQLRNRHGGLRVLLVAGSAAGTAVATGSGMPGVEWLAMPFSPDQLAVRVREVVDAR